MAEPVDNQDADEADGEAGPESAEPSPDTEPAAESAPESEPESERALQRARRIRRRRGIRIALLAVTATTALGAAAAFGLAAWDIQHLTHNLKHTALLPAGFTEPAEPVDALGRSPVNILVLGSDTRATAADSMSCDL